MLYILIYLGIGSTVGLFDLDTLNKAIDMARKDGVGSWAPKAVYMTMWPIRLGFIIYNKIKKNKS